MRDTREVREHGKGQTDTVSLMLEVVDRLNPSGASPDFASRMVEAFGELFPNSIRALDIIWEKTGTTSSALSANTPGRETHQRVVRRHMKENPIVRHLTAGGRGGVFDLEDFIDRRGFRKTSLFRCALQPLGLERQLLITFQAHGAIAALTINRGWDVPFTAAERECCERLRPILVRRFDQQVERLRLLDALSPCEREVLRYVIESKRDSEIALILGRKVKTVNCHVSHLLEKTGLENRAALIVNFRDFAKHYV